ncbi:hypothetical protein PGT21_015780 [Puccinia graminis f. sp. tritici]|uniref:Uncharacterized protein n=1 Tax=Puccinia graminis f. sp. tritici TaxID=56615 RepID=A0A5B0NKK0_PUCGR|nr:hypothetical protein PGT21_015780 [Puccinia graminis f. sp. tritici]KAA1089855.1 hypothetical protein PGTUg99_023758 [Puccinia graminis f. sp. tritici]
MPYLVDEIKSRLPAAGGIVLFNHSQSFFLPFFQSWWGLQTSLLLARNDLGFVHCDSSLDANSNSTIGADEPTVASADARRRAWCFLGIMKDPLMPPGA